MATGDEEVRAELARLREELDNAVMERRRLTQLLQQKPDLKRLDETQGLLQAAEVARSSTEERNLELVRLLSQGSARQQQLESELAEQQRQNQQQMAELQQQLSELQQERDELLEKVVGELPANGSEMALKLHQQLKQFHKTSKDKLEGLAEELKRRHRLWEQETQNRTQLENSFELQSQAFQREIADLKKTVRDAQADLSDHVFALETSEEQISWLEDEVQEREEIIESLRSQVAAYLDKLRKAQSKLNEAGEALQHRNSMLKQFQEQRLMLASQCRTWEASFNNSERQRQEQQEQISKLRERIEELEWELEETHVSLEDSQHQVASLQDQLFQQLPKAHAMLRQARGEDTLTDLKAVEEKQAADM